MGRVPSGRVGHRRAGVMVYLPVLCEYVILQLQQSTAGGICMRPEDRAREKIDAMLEEAGWVVQDRQRLNLSAGRGIALRYFAMSKGEADYLLFVDEEPVGTIEAKKEGMP